MLGISQLTANLTDLLVERIQISLPFIKWELQSQLQLAEKDVEVLGQGLPFKQSDQCNLLVKLMSAYCSVMRQSVFTEFRAGVNWFSGFAEA